MQHQYNHGETIKYLQYLGANKLYRRAMTQKLPTHWFVWEEKLNDFTPEKIDKLVKKTRKGIF